MSHLPPTPGSDHPDKESAPLAGEAGSNEALIPNDTPEKTIRKFLYALILPDNVFEVRALKCADRPGSTFTSTVAGYYQHAQIDTAVQHIVQLDASGTAPVIYITLNPINPALLARSTNRLKNKVKEATADKDIIRRLWLLLDCDPVRPSGISSTSAELRAAGLKARTVRMFLSAMGWPEPIVVMSGNGVHLLYRIDLPAEDGDLVQRVLDALGDRFDDEMVKIDRSVHNAARITKVAGTIAANKGDSMVGVEGIEDRPHRRAALLSVPDQILPVPVELLEALAATVPSGDPGPVPAAPRLAASASANSKFERFEQNPAGVRGYLERHGISIKSESRDGAATYLYLDQCPVVTDCQSSGDSDIAVIVGYDGKIGYKNLHNRGEGLGWIDVRDALEPGYRQWVESKGWQAPTAATNQPPPSWSPPRPLTSGPIPPAFPLTDAFPDSVSDVRAFVGAQAEALQVPVDLTAMLLLPFVGVSIAQKFEIELRSGWREVPAIYSLSLLESGERKSATFSAMIAPITEWEHHEAMRLESVIAAANEERKVLEGRLAEERRKASKGNADSASAKAEALRLAQELAATPILKAPCIYSSDATSEGLVATLVENQERALVASPEADAVDVMMGRYSEKGSPNMGIWLKGHAGDSESVIRRGRPREHLKRPIINVALTIQPEGARGMFASQAARGRGLLGRFVTSAPVSLVGNRKTGGTALPVSDWLTARYRDTLRYLLDLPIDSDGPQIVRLTADANALFVAFEASIERQLGRGGCLGDRKDWGGKLCGVVARIALILYVLQLASDPTHLGRSCAGCAGSAHMIDGPTMRAALSWAPYLIEHERHVAGVVGCDPVMGTADKLLAWLERTLLRSFSKRDAYDANRSVSVRVADDVDAPLELLEELGYIRGRPPASTANKMGRPASPVFDVNPLWKQGGRP